MVGATAADEAVVRLLRRSGKPVILAANKVDDERGEADAAALWSLGLGEPYPVSARCTAAAWPTCSTRCSRRCPTVSELASGERRPAPGGAGRASRTSASPRCSTGWPARSASVVDDVAGTTVDPVDSLVELGGKMWRFVDTAGLRRRVGQASGHGVLRLAAHPGRARGGRGGGRADRRARADHRAGPARDHRWSSRPGRALVLAFNKWDLVDEDRPLPSWSARSSATCAQRAVGAAGQHLGATGRRGAQARAGAARRRWTSWDTADSDRPAQRVPRRARRRDAAAGARRQAAADPVRHPGRRPGRRRSCCSPPGSWRPGTAGSSSGGCARRSASRAPRSGSTSGCARSAEHALADVCLGRRQRHANVRGLSSDGEVLRDIGVATLHHDGLC